ncbi:DUF5050 domain-containing protein [Paenibacillus anaericanus]|uniref:DUF5050 domain-containing protein n=1 Tax=Paenibacillus anaericanus TaxID=170367 RepID=A0A3S1KC65_9BACL|nr:DUF5050 domain-containing protein [Paenibacillus anaericanus]RUT48667.1 DUF5050 domain-containing protein [Paenibacillus anaericanus]
MRKILISTIMIIALLIGALPASAAVKENKVVWLGDYADKASRGVNLSIVDGKTNITNRIYQEDAFSPILVGDWVYFLKQNPDSDVIMGQIVKAKVDGSELTEVTKESTYSSFTVEGQVIYFGGYDKDYKNQIGSMNLDGTGEKVLFSGLSFWSYTVGKGYVFYVDTENGSILYRMKLDGTGKTAISKKSVAPRDGGYALFGSTLFFSEETYDVTPQKWYLQEADGKNLKTFTSKGTVTPIAFQNKVFFFEETIVNKSKKSVTTLTKINREGTGKKTVATIAEGDKFIGVVGTTFVYKTAAGKIYQIGQDGKVTKLAK